MLQLQSISLQRGKKVLLEHADFNVFPGQKWGIVGANGSGKSTLFKLILREIQEDSGQLSLPSDWRIAHMAQEIQSTQSSALDYVIDGDPALRKLQKALESDAHSGEKLAQLYQEMETIDGYSAEARAERLLSGLGFAAGDSLKAVSSFSGGWRIRLNLAQALMSRSDLLLLDEPTNHLDLDATLWLEQWLKQYPGTLLVISHDRDFLDNLVDGIVQFEAQKLCSYRGNYSAFERQRAEMLAQQTAEFDKQQKRISEIERFVERFRAKATKAKQAQSRLKELQRMEKIAPAHVDSPFSFSFPAPERVPQTLLTLDKVEVGYENTIVDNVNFSLHGNSRIGLLGHNGAGKSSLLKTLATLLPALSGELIPSAHLKIGYYAQHQLEALDLHASCALHLQRLDKQATEQAVRNFLGGFGFQGDRAFEPIEHFSGGEKARLALAILAWQKPNLLLLDEPTNHLDLEMRHALTLALQEWEGALVVVSHDRHLLRSTVDEFLLVDRGRLTPFEGSLDDYQTWLLQDKSANESEAANESPRTDRKEQRKQEAAIRQQLSPFNKKIKQIEHKLTKLDEELNTVETTLADASIYTGEQSALEALLQQQGRLNKEKESLEEEWMCLTEEKENLEKQLSTY